MNPGDRVIIQSCRPAYLNGKRGTVVRPQPGEARTIVRLDNDPAAKKYGGNEWCLQNFCLAPDPAPEGINLFGLIRDAIGPAAQTAAENIVRELAPAIEEAASEFGFRHSPEFLGDTWRDVYKPAILWRFYWHLANELRLISEGHETVMFESGVEA